MKTILGTFSGATGKPYSFNIDKENIKVGDIISSNEYKANIIVKEVFSKLYTHGDYNGNLYEDKSPLSKFEIKEITEK